MNDHFMPAQCQECISRYERKQRRLAFLGFVTALVTAAAICYLIQNFNGGTP